MGEFQGEAIISADEIAEHTRKIRDLCQAARAGIMPEAVRQAIDGIAAENSAIYNMVMEAWEKHHELANVPCRAHREIAERG